MDNHSFTVRLNCHLDGFKYHDSFYQKIIYYYCLVANLP